MNANASIVTKAFLLKCPPEKKEKLFSFLSPEDQTYFQELPLSFNHDPTEGLSPSEKRIQFTHFSWLAPLFRTFSENEMRIFLSALSEEQATGLKKNLLLTNHSAKVNPFSKPFLQKALWKKAHEKELLSVECLPDSPLNPLLEFNLSELVTLIDLLGVHDLAVQVKQIIETAKLKQIDKALTPLELNLLKTLLHRKEVLTFKSFSLQKWDGAPESLREVLQQRGLNRLAKSLYRKEISLLWYVSRILDIERGQLLLKLATPLEQVRAQEILIGQVVELMPVIKTSKPQMPT
jgi:hypothetical protein